MLAPFVDPNQSRQVVISKLIHDHVGEFSMNPKDLKTPYVALYKMLKGNTTLVRNIAVEMAKESVKFRQYNHLIF